MVRWWDGVQWSPQTHPRYAAPDAQAGAYLPAAQDNGRKVASSTRLMRMNGLGFAGAAMGIGSALINPIFLTSILAIIFCAIGLVKDAKLRRAGQTATGRGWIIAGLVVAVGSVVFYAFLVVLPLLYDMGMH